MRKKHPQLKALRTKRGFLLFPRYIDGEWRWLEFATWQEKYDGVWESYKWIEEEK